jgi:hypothetical protein
MVGLTAAATSGRRTASPPRSNSTELALPHKTSLRHRRLQRPPPPVRAIASARRRGAKRREYKTESFIPTREGAHVPPPPPPPSATHNYKYLTHGAEVSLLRRRLEVLDELWDVVALALGLRGLLGSERGSELLQDVHVFGAKLGDDLGEELLEL